MAGRKIILSKLRMCARLQCTITEAAGALGVSFSKLSKAMKTDPRVRRVWDEGQQQGRASLRRKQMRLADTNATMAIWLGKQYLDQKDVQHQRYSGEDGGPVQIDVRKLSPNDRSQLRRSLRSLIKS